MGRINSLPVRSTLPEDISPGSSVEVTKNVMTGKKPQIFAYPFGFFCRESVDTLKQMGIRLSLGCEEGTAYVSDSDSLINMKRYNRAHGKTSEAFFKKILK